MANRPAEITLRLQSVEQMLLTSDAPLYSKRILKEDIETFIVEEAADIKPGVQINIIVHIPVDEVERAEEVVTAIHRHFDLQKHKSEKQLKQTLRLGWRSLFIGFVFLCIMYLLTQAISHLLPKGGLATTIHEFLIILGWVALWRPAELLLYEWYPFRRDADLFERIERSKIEVVTEE